VSSSTGEWQERGTALDYLTNRGVHCKCCGRLIARRAWIVDARVFCNADCARVFREYVLPRYGG
jgi:hypothetical protein